MSIEIDWERLTGGPDGEQLAETIRLFVHDKFQQVTLPRFIRSVHVHSFDFGSVAPSIELKDICDPLADFYEEDEEGTDDETDDGGSGRDDATVGPTEPSKAFQSVPSGYLNDPHRRNIHGGGLSHGGPDASSMPQPRLPYLDTRISSQHAVPGIAGQRSASPMPMGTLTPGIPGGTSNLSYFHLPLGAGISGTATPLAAVAGAKFHGGRPETHPTREVSIADREHHHHSASISSLTPPSSLDPASRPPSQHLHEASTRPSRAGSESHPQPEVLLEESFLQEPRMRERSVEDVQVVSHVKYSGDFKLSLTAEILLDYPMESFVGIPLKLNITGMTFDGVAILAHIKKRAHFCFLSPEDGNALIGDSNTAADDAHLGDGSLPMASHPKIGGLLEEIHVESEIGQKENGKQVLKNVGKVEKFVLEQVRRIFEEEFVYPSFWTFLV